MATAAVNSTSDATSGAKKYCLSDLISLSDNVPFRVKFLTRDSQISSQLSQGTVMDIYSIQWSKAVILSHRDQKQVEYIMPFDSSFKCSPIFNPNNNTKEATTRGYQYNSVKELQLANPQPIAVHVSMGYLDAEDTSASMEAGDVYVMRKKSQLPGAAPPDDVLVCEDTVTHQFKYLHSSSSCYLNTSPNNLLLKPTDFFLSLIPPADILIHNLPSILRLSDVFVVKGIIPLLTLTTHILSKTVVLDIYGHGELPAEVELLNVPPLEYKQMKLRAELESMTTSKDESNRHQMLIVFMTENATKVSFTNNTLQKLFLTSKQSNSDGDYILELHSAAIVKTAKLNRTICCEENRNILQSYSVSDVCDLLVQLGIEQYCDVFAHEQISGMLLAELTDDILKDELGMKRKLDRIKIQVIQQGTKSIKDVMAKKKYTSSMNKKKKIFGK